MDSSLLTLLTMGLLGQQQTMRTAARPSGERASTLGRKAQVTRKAKNKAASRDRKQNRRNRK